MPRVDRIARRVHLQQIQIQALPAAPISLAARIAALERELAELRQQQRAEFLVTIASVVPAHVDFSAKELFAFKDQHPVLIDAFRDMRIHNARSLGRRLQQIAAAGRERGLALERIGHDRDGVIYTVR